MPQQTIVSEINEELVKLGAVTREGDRPLTCADIFDIIDVHSYAQPNLGKYIKIIGSSFSIR